ncbi:MAG: cupin domain-containing protein [Betaproteobacteria bacterium]|jgi:hypothetical protein
MQYHVGHLQHLKYALSEGFLGQSSGFERMILTDRRVGSVHSQTAMLRLQPGVFVLSVVHAFEKGIYVFEGELEMMRAGEWVRLPTDSFALIPTATAHGLRNVGSSVARWFEISAPQPKPVSSLQEKG